MEFRHYKIPQTRIPARPVQKPLPIYVAGHTEVMFRAAARHGYRVLASGMVRTAALLAERFAENARAIAPLARQAAE